MIPLGGPKNVSDYGSTLESIYLGSKERHVTALSAYLKRTQFL
jgi:hypothetical protein